MDRLAMTSTSYPESFMSWTILIVLLPLSLSRVNNSQTVTIGIIVDMESDQFASINRSVELAASVSNTTVSAKMNPIFVRTDLDDSFKLRKALCSLIDQQPIALFGPSRSETFSIIESHSRALNIPFFLLSETRGDFQKDNYIISMCPSFIDAVIDLIKFFQWDRVFYFFDSDDGLWRLQKLYKAFGDSRNTEQTKPVFIDALRIYNVISYRDVLRQFDRNFNLEVKRIVVDLNSVHRYDIFMSQITDVGMNRVGYHYILGTLDIQGINTKLWRSFTFGGVNITGFQLINRKYLNYRQVNLLQRLDDPKLLPEAALIMDAIAVLTTAVVNIMNNTDILRFRRGELYNNMSCNSDPVFSLPNGTSILQHILNVSGTTGLSGFVAFDENGHRQKYKLDVVHLGYQTRLQEVGEWHQSKGLTMMSPKSGGAEIEIKPADRIRYVAAIENEPFVRLKAPVNGTPNVGNERFEGYCIDMLETIAVKTNFTYRIESINGGWNRILELLLNGTADIAIGSITITRKREEVVHFTKPFMNTGISIMIKKPERDKPGVFSFAEPLALEVWGCIISGYLAVSFVLYMVGRFSPYEWLDDEAGGHSTTFTFINTLWFSLGALMQQGPDKFPRSFSGRVLASAWWFFTLITVSSYTANLAAFLTFEKLTAPISSVDSLVRQDKIKYGTQSNGSTYEFFQDSNVPIYKEMANEMKAAGSYVFVDSVVDGWKKVLQDRGKYAFLLESSSNDFYNQRKPCKTMKVGRNLDQKGYGIATPKNSDLSHSLNIAVLEMLESGDLKRLEEKWWLSKGECGNTDSGDKTKDALNLSNVAGIFHVLIGGLVLAMVTSLSQILFFTKVRRRNRKNKYKIKDYKPEYLYQRPTSKHVTLDTNPVILCTPSNEEEPQLISFDGSLSDVEITKMEDEDLDNTNLEDDLT